MNLPQERPFEYKARGIWLNNIHNEYRLDPQKKSNQEFCIFNADNNIEGYICWENNSNLKWFTDNHKSRFPPLFPIFKGRLLKNGLIEWRNGETLFYWARENNYDKFSRDKYKKKNKLTN